MFSSESLLLDRLRKAFEPHGAQADFCRKSGLPRRTVDNWLGGTAIPLTAIEPIAKGLGVKPWELIKPDGDQTTQRMSRSALIGEIIVQLGHLNDVQVFGVLKNLEALVLGSLQDKKLVHKNR